MPTCDNCSAELAAEDLIRHDHEELQLVHCPDCGFMLGTYNRHSEPPQTDTRHGN